MSIAALRKKYHENICRRILYLREGVPNIADSGSRASVAIALEIVRMLGEEPSVETPSAQTAGTDFEQLTKEFLEESFALLRHLRPGRWLFSVSEVISRFDQYEHLADLQQLLREMPGLAAALGGGYVVTPDIVVGRYPVADGEINQVTTVVGDAEELCRLAPLRARIRPDAPMILHASISCKWTIRSDRAQNVRTEALNLIRNRKGHTPHVAVVTAEPLPTRIASLALGTGDLDGVYHFALPELRGSVETVGNEEQMEMLSSMIDGRRLRDISDLPLDLAI